MSALLFPCLVVAGCLALSFALSGMEAGILVLSRFRVRRQMRSGVRGAKLLHEYLENPENFLWTILVGNTLATFLAFSLIVVGLYYAFDGRLGGFVAAFTAVVLLFYLLCDLLPKMLFRQFPNRLCLGLAMPFRLLHNCLSPLVALLTWFSDLLLRWTGQPRFQGRIFSSRREVRLAIQESAQILTSEERQMVNRVLDLPDLTVRSITVPLSRVVGVTTTSRVGDVLDLARRQPVNRVPVWQGNGADRRIVGIISLSSLLYAHEIDVNESIAGYVRAPLIFQEDTRLEEALRRMQRTRQRMAIVVDFDQRELGIVNLRDILKSIFGEVTL